MRVLHVYSGNLFGGIEAILVAIARRGTHGISVRHEFALCFDDRLSAELTAAGARVHLLEPVRLSRPHTARAARQSLDGVLRANAFDRVICHAPWAQAIFGGVARRAAVPLVFWAHDVMTGRHWTERLARRIVPDFVICNSEYTAGSLRHLYPTAPSAVVYAPVEQGSDMAGGPGRVEIRASLLTPETDVVIVQASRSEAWKGHALLVDALARLAAVPGWTWWQVGGAQRPAEEAFLRGVREQVERAGIGARVRWVGQRNDVPRLLGAADVYCQANLSPEPFGVAFVEALASGLPVVTTDLGGAREIVDATCGILVKSADPSALADALRQMILDAPGRTRLAAAAPARATRLCDPETQLQRLASVLEHMSPATDSTRGPTLVGPRKQ
jgi:glycosyltransferase involved in cell wall biosynthesis